MSENQKVVYVYDGTFEGFLCCVYNFYYNRLKPVQIVSQAEFEPSFYENYIVETDYEQAYRVRFAIEEKISHGNLEFLTDCFLTSLEEKEMYMLKYIVKGFKVGGRIINNISDDDVNALWKAHRHLKKERHDYCGLVRFYKAGDVYISKINPKDRILPLITWHFVQRFHTQNFMIYDETHGQALIYYDKAYKIIYVDDVKLPEVDDDELSMQKLWKHFYDTIAIKERYNPKCRMSFMPKRRWENLPEMKDENYFTKSNKY